VKDELDMNDLSDSTVTLRAAFFWEGSETASIRSLTENGKQIVIPEEDRSGAGGVGVEWETGQGEQPTVNAVLAFPGKKLRNLRFSLEVNGAIVASNSSREEQNRWATQVSSPLFIPAAAEISWDGNKGATLRSLVVNTIELPLEDGKRTGTGKIDVSWEMQPALNYTLIADLVFRDRTLKDLKFEVNINGKELEPAESDEEGGHWNARVFL
jgi:hypothetical protein